MKEPDNEMGPDADRERFRQASELFAQALDRDPELRRAFLDERCGGDAALQAEVLGLLDAHEQEGILDGAFAPPGPESDLKARVMEALSDRYRIVERLGEGGTAVVFLAWEKKHDRKVVLKVLRPDVQALLGHARFLEEVRLASGLSHPHILPFIDSGSADGLLYYVMPHVEGESLYERLDRDAPLGATSALPILRDVAEALAYAHAEGVIHRDLKPGNVLCAGAHAYLMDFGVAKALRSAPSSAPRTGVGFVPGTPRYMAPEQARADSDVGPSADVFAWGQLAHECLTGTVSDLGTTPDASSARGVDSAREMVELPAALPPGLTRLVRAALAPNPSHRPTAAALSAALNGMMRPDARAPSSDRRAAARRTAGWLLGTAAAMAILAFGLSRRMGAPGPEPATLAGPLAVAEFRNETGDPTLDFLGRLAGDWITQGLQDLGTAPVAPWPSSLAASRAALADGVLDPVPYLQAATGAETVVTGSFYRVGDELRFQAQVVDVEEQAVRLALDAVRAPESRPEDAVGELRDRIMGGVAVLSGRRVALPELANRAPTFEAYRLFDRAMSHYLAQEYSEATPAFLEAYARDTTFTSSLIYGATTAWNQGDRHVTDSLVQVLAARRDRLSEHDDLRWQMLAALLRADGQEALRVLRRSSELAPGGRDGYNLARQATTMNRPAEALTALRAIDPESGAMSDWAQYWTQLTHALHLLGDHREEVEAARVMIRRHPERTIAPVLEARALAAAGDLEALDAALDRSAIRSPRTYWSHGAALVVAGEELLAHHGPTVAEPYLRAAVSWLEPRIVLDPDYLAYRYWLASAWYDLGLWTATREASDALLEASPTSTAYLGMAAVAAARTGDRDGSQGYLAEDRWGYALGDRRVYAARVEGILGDPDRALDLIAQAFDRGVDGFPWMHASGYHDFVVLRSDPRIATLLEPQVDP